MSIPVMEAHSGAFQSIPVRSGPFLLLYAPCPGPKFQLLIKTKMLKIKTFLAFKLSDVLFIMLINVKMSTIVGILTFMSMINFMLS